MEQIKLQNAEKELPQIFMTLDEAMVSQTWHKNKWITKEKNGISSKLKALICQGNYQESEKYPIGLMFSNNLSDKGGFVYIKNSTTIKTSRHAKRLWIDISLTQMYSSNAHEMILNATSYWWNVNKNYQTNTILQTSEYWSSNS